MKKLIIVFTVVLSLLWQGASSQNLIAVQNGGAAAFYTVLDSAIFHAQNGDTIYLPGGGFSIHDTISKRIHLVGSGHHPDSANVTDRTIINGNRQLVLKTGADYGSCTGIYFNEPGYYGYPNIWVVEPVSGYTISRCIITKSISSSLGNYFTIAENIIVDLGFYGNNNSVVNNIFLGVVGLNASFVKNNVFTFSQPGYSQSAFYGSGCIVENNIFKDGSAYLGSSNIYHNNVNGGVNWISGDNQGSGNFLDNVELSSIFVNYNPATVGGEGIYDSDFHLPPDSPYKNAGRDGTDIGIYGGACPWKEGSIPFNPHFQSLQIAPTTDSIGNLNVNIKVAAQDH